MFTLIVMAAGVGSRYGGVKQLVPVGPNGETFMDLVIADAVSAGAEKVVIVTRSQILKSVQEHMSLQRQVAQRKSVQHKNLKSQGVQPQKVQANDASDDVEIVYVCQDEHTTQQYGQTQRYGHGSQRSKPWGTAHAVLTAAPEVHGCFMVCNADDYYGTSSIGKLSQQIIETYTTATATTTDTQHNNTTTDTQHNNTTAQHTLTDTDTQTHRHTDTPSALLCLYRLGFTLPAHRPVSRGVCDVRDGHLLAIHEHYGVERRADGVIVAARPQTTLAENTPVSMNLWGFPHMMFDWLDDGFADFLKKHSKSADAEYLLPSVVTSKLADGSLNVRTIETNDKWAGVTHVEDLPTAKRVLSQIITAADTSTHK